MGLAPKESTLGFSCNIVAFETKTEDEQPLFIWENALSTDHMEDTVWVPLLDEVGAQTTTLVKNMLQTL